MNNTNPGANALNDGKAIAKQALVGLQAVCDTTLNKVSGEVPKLTGDALEIANAFITKNLSHFGPLASILTGILQTGERAVEGAIDAKGAAYLAIFKTDVDSAFGHLEKPLSSLVGDLPPLPPSGG